MKTPRCHLTSSAAALLLLATASTVGAQQPQPPHDHTHTGAGAPPAAPAKPAKPAAPGKGMDMSKQMPDCAAMMRMHQQMEADRKADDARLNDLTTKMNEATGDQKTEAMAAVISELVAQRARARELDEKMQGQMMAHMMGHTQHGAAASPMQCPMTKAMAGHGAGTSGASGDHARHHP
jgi:hypothetical protein